MKAPFLIIGYERSGTTLLRRLVSMHPLLEYELVHERPELLMAAKDVDHAVATMTYPATQARKKTGSIMSIRAGQKIPYSDYGRAARCVAKFRLLFPSSSIMHIVRSPADAISSQVRTFGRDANDGIVRYFYSVPKVSQYLLTLSGVRTVRYEDMIRQPKEMLADLYAWMGSTVEPSHIARVISTKDPWKHGDRVMPGLRYFDSVEYHPHETVLSAAQIKAIRQLEENGARVSCTQGRGWANSDGSCAGRTP